MLKIKPVLNICKNFKPDALLKDIIKHAPQGKSYEINIF